jgi:anti-anti-sigma factor
VIDIREETSGAVRVVAPVGRIDSSTSSELERVLMRCIADDARAILVDFAGVEYISSAGLSVLLKTASALRTRKRLLVLCSLGRSVREVFELAGFTAIFSIEPSRAAALARLGAPPV